jgi:hypothetical protein
MPPRIACPARQLRDGDGASGRRARAARFVQANEVLARQRHQFGLSGLVHHLPADDARRHGGPVLLGAASEDGQALVAAGHLHDGKAIQRVAVRAEELVAVAHCAAVLTREVTVLCSWHHITCSASNGSNWAAC